MCQEPWVCALELYKRLDTEPVLALPLGIVPRAGLGGTCSPVLPPGPRTPCPPSSICHQEIQLSEVCELAKNKLNKLVSIFKVQRCSLIWHFNLLVKLSRVFAQRVAKS